MKSCGTFCKWGAALCGVLAVRARPFGVYVWGPGFVEAPMLTPTDFQVAEGMGGKPRGSETIVRRSPGKE